MSHNELGRCRRAAHSAQCSAATRSIVLIQRQGHSTDRGSRSHRFLSFRQTHTLPPCMPPCAAFDQVCIGSLGGGLWSIWALFTAFLVEQVPPVGCRHVGTSDKRRETARPGPAHFTVARRAIQPELTRPRRSFAGAVDDARLHRPTTSGGGCDSGGACVSTRYSRIKIKAHEVCAWRVVAVARGGRLSPLAHPAPLLQRACRHTPSLPAERHMCPAAGQPHMHQDKCFKKKVPLLARID